MRQEGLESHDISIFVEEKTEYIHSRISLKPVKSAIEQATKLSITFGGKANTSLGKILHRKIQKRADNMEKGLTRLVDRRHPKHRRSKRAIEFVGNLISKLFGNPGPEEWKQNKRNVLAMKEAISRQLANSAILHTDIDHNRHMINEHSEVLRQTLKIVNSNENRLSNVDNELNELETYLELETMFDSIDQILEALTDVRHDAKTGRCSEKGLDPEFLIEHLRDLESNKNSIAPVFASWEWQSYYIHELCSIALHEDELWITMRIPIVNIAEQFVRAVPLSDQMWIRETFDSLGFENSLFRLKQQDIYMIVTNANLEICSTFGSTRVCNIRKTKFREANDCIVPLDINHNRVLFITNSTAKNVEVKSICGNSVTSLNVTGNTAVVLPDRCSLISKTFEVSKIATIRNMSTYENLGQIESFTLTVKRRNASAATLRVSNNLTHNDNDNEFQDNIDKALDSLGRVKYTDTWSKDAWFVATSSSTMILLISLLTIFLIVKCKKTRKANRKSNVIVNINKTNELDGQDEEQAIPLSDKNDPPCNCSNASIHNELETPNEQSTSARPMCQFKR